MKQIQRLENRSKLERLKKMNSIIVTSIRRYFLGAIFLKVIVLLLIAKNGILFISMNKRDSLSK